MRARLHVDKDENFSLQHMKPALLAPILYFLTPRSFPLLMHSLITTIIVYSLPVSCTTRSCLRFNVIPGNWQHVPTKRLSCCAPGLQELVQVFYTWVFFTWELHTCNFVALMLTQATCTVERNNTVRWLTGGLLDRNKTKANGLTQLHDSISLPVSNFYHPM